MAFDTFTVHGDLDRFVTHVRESLVRSSATMSIECETRSEVAGARMVVLGCERFSVVGSSRVALTVSTLESGGAMQVVAVATGGSQAVVFKINTFGEQAMLDVAREAVTSFRG